MRAHRCRRISGSIGIGADLEPPHHEIHQCLPVGKGQVAGERAQIVEEGLARGQGGADEPIVGVGEGLKGVKEKTQDVHRGQEGGQMPFAVPKVVLQMRGYSALKSEPLLQPILLTNKLVRHDKTSPFGTRQAHRSPPYLYR